MTDTGAPAAVPYDPEAVVVLALDVKDGESETGFSRRYFACRGARLAEGAPVDGALGARNAHELASKGVFDGESGKVVFAVYPTRTYSEGFGGGLFTEIAPEDRSVIRGLKRRFPGKVECVKVPLDKTSHFEEAQDYFKDGDERSKYAEERKAASDKKDAAAGSESGSWVAFDSGYLKNMGDIFKSCMTKPNRQDYMWLVTKTFTLNLAIRLFFVVQSVKSGQLPMARAVVSTSWYQLQDAVFTVFGQTYMKFLGKMTPMVKLKNAAVGDFVFVYIQLCSMEFINRLVLGPLGENPLVYTAEGIGLIFVNILQGMISGGPIIPAVNKMRKVGAISHSTMMHFYQLASLTMHFGLFASFGFQKFYAILTGAVLVLAWGSYVLFSTMFKDPKFGKVDDEAQLRAVDAFAGRCWAAGGGHA
jgi:hypothetical protein